MSEKKQELSVMEPEVMMGDEAIKSRIFTIRGVQVMLDRDLARFYGVTTGALNQAVKRNIARFPDRFMFRMSKEELANLKSQFVISSWGGDRSLPYVFTEQGVAMLSGLLKSDTAIQISIRIMDAFVVMRKTLASIAPILARITTIENRQIEDRIVQRDTQALNEERFEKIFKAMDGDEFPPQQVFFDGKHYEAYSFARKLVKKAKKSIVVVDPFVDGKELYHFGSSLNQLGRHYCAVVKMDPGFIPSILSNI